MRAITVQPPWSACIAEGYKDIENRSRNVKYRGPLAIHAGLRWSTRGAFDPRVQRALGVRFTRGDAPWGLPSGAVLAVAQLVDCHEAQPAARLDGTAGWCCEPWGELEYAGRRVHHLVLEDVRELDEPVPCSGRLGLWTLPDYVVSALSGMEGR